MIGSGGPRPYPMPALSRMMVFADGENIVSRYQAMQKQGFEPRPDVQHERDVYAWHQQAVRPDLHHVIRATYYTSAAGDEQTIWDIDEKIRSLQFQQYSLSGGGDISGLLGNTLSGVVLKRMKNQQKSKGVDIHLTVDILINAYRNNLDTVYVITGDGDFVPVLEEVKRLGKRIYVAAFSSGLHRTIRAVADRFVDLDGCFFLTK
jgi:uncharacterized LabA/DUF88 family protein